ncbi:MAG: hypothetical protein OEV78_11260 [Spirochaetia bacterium]|nr:hypothetical protein [Spirochaetia bacterium]
MKFRFFIQFVSFLFSSMPLWASLSPDGSFNYEVKISVPQGTNQLTPQIKLNYNSNNFFRRLFG